MQRHNCAEMMVHPSNIPRTRVHEILVHLPLKLFINIFLQVYSWVYLVESTWKQSQWQQVEYLNMVTIR